MDLLDVLVPSSQSNPFQLGDWGCEELGLGATIEHAGTARQRCRLLKRTETRRESMLLAYKKAKSDRKPLG